MSGNHGIEELTRQFDQAKSRLNAAKVSFREARRRLAEARAAELAEDLAARGITPGTIVTNGKTKWGFMRTAITDVWEDSTHPIMVLHSIKRDGTISARRVRPFGVTPHEIRPVEADT